MGIAALVLGIISIVIGWIPFICFIAFVLAVIGLILGIVDTVKKNKIGDKRRAMSIAGLIVCAVAIPVIIISSLISLGILAAVIAEDSYYTDYDWYYDYYDDYDYKYNWDRFYDSIEYYELRDSVI